MTLLLVCPGWSMLLLVLDPHTQDKIFQLEKIQRRAARWTTVLLLLLLLFLVVLLIKRDSNASKPWDIDRRGVMLLVCFV